jgi:hypothetical protein
MMKFILTSKKISHAVEVIVSHACHKHKIMCNVRDNVLRQVHTNVRQSIKIEKLRYVGPEFFFQKCMRSLSIEDSTR